jgi:hypothetical protein
MAVITDISLWELIKHLGSWLTNLRRAGSQRKEASIGALRAVILAARDTTVYVRQLNDTGLQDHHEETRLSLMWTELSFRLTDLGLNKLAKRCDIKGRFWANPNQFEDGFLDKADVSLEKMEQLARQMVVEIER